MCLRRLSLIGTKTLLSVGYQLTSPKEREAQRGAVDISDPPGHYTPSNSSLGTWSPVRTSKWRENSCFTTARGTTPIPPLLLLDGVPACIWSD